MKLPRLMIAAPKSGSGKTVVTCAVLALLKEYLEKPKMQSGKSGSRLQAFKCGPDFIDPMFHREIIGVESRNLDSFFVEAGQLRELFRRGQNEGNLAVIEGVMGLYDGLGGIREEASSYEVAGILQVPIVLVVDAKGMGRSILPLLEGFLEYDRLHLIKGVILNRVGKSFCDVLAPEIEGNLGLPVLGCLPERKEYALESRHLGLKLPGEVSKLKERVKLAAEELKKTVVPERLLKIAAGAAEFLEEPAVLEPAGRGDVDTLEEPVAVRIGIARDEAFCFYYEDNLRILRELGAELVPFSPLWDERLPDGLDGLLLGGGYPELWLERLQENRGMRASIQKALADGMPSVAECGGFMYLHEAVEDPEGKRFDMCGVLPAICRNAGKSMRFGYITVRSADCGKEQGCFLAADRQIRAHEFHYYDSTAPGAHCVAVKPVSGRTWECVWADETHWWGFPHLYYPSEPGFVRNFISAAIAYKNCHLPQNVR